MYHIFENTLDTLLGRVHSNTMKTHKEQISKEKEESMNQSKLVCDCESYCEKYKVQVPKEEENKPIPSNQPGLMTTIANFFSNINNKNKPIDKGSEKKPLQEKPIEEKPLEEKPIEEKPLEEEPLQEKPLEEKPLEEKPLEEEPIEEKPLEEKPIEEKPLNEEPIEEKPLKEKPIEEEPLQEKPIEENPIEEKSIEENVLPNNKKYNKLIVKCDELY